MCLLALSPAVQSPPPYCKGCCRFSLQFSLPAPPPQLFLLVPLIPTESFVWRRLWRRRKSYHQPGNLQLVRELDFAAYRMIAAEKAAPSLVFLYLCSMMSDMWHHCTVIIHALHVVASGGSRDPEYHDIVVAFCIAALGCSHVMPVTCSSNLRYICPDTELRSCLHTRCVCTID